MADEYAKMLNVIHVRRGGCQQMGLAIRYQQGGSWVHERRGKSGGKTKVGGTKWMWFYDGGCSRAAWVEGCFRRHGFRTWARGEP